jgi:hypothetical protein
MTNKQLHYIFDGRDSNEDIHKYFHSIITTAGYQITSSRYPVIEVNYDAELLIITAEDGAKEYYDFIDINGVREHHKFDNNIKKAIQDNMYIPR